MNEYQKFIGKVQFWKDKLQGHESKKGVCGLIEEMNSAINIMNEAINSIDRVTGEIAPEYVNDFECYEKNFDVVMAYIHALVNNNYTELSISDALCYISTDLVAVNPTVLYAADYLISYEVDQEGNNEKVPKILQDEENNQKVGGLFDKDNGDEDTYDSGVYTAIVDFNYYNIDPVAKVESEVVIPGLGSIIDFSFFATITV